VVSLVLAVAPVPVLLSLVLALALYGLFHPKASNLAH
tara:strand:- start:68 stop:178 length:111 start_codon:yes stop_codon:yes gene_type:complete